MSIERASHDRKETNCWHKEPVVLGPAAPERVCACAAPAVPAAPMVGWGSPKFYLTSDVGGRAGLVSHGMHASRGFEF